MWQTKAKSIPLPKGWSRHVRCAMLHAISLAQFAASYTRGWAANSINTRARLKAELDRLNTKMAWLGEELRIKNARMSCINPQRRPHYPP